MRARAAEYHVTFSPTEYQLSEIEKWLIDENNKKGEGFYCNWQIIKTSFAEKRLAVISHKSNTIGFVTFIITLGLLNLVGNTKPN